MDFSGFVALRLPDLVKVARSLTGDASAADDLTQIPQNLPTPTSTDPTAGTPSSPRETTTGTASCTAARRSNSCPPRRARSTRSGCWASTTWRAGDPLRLTVLGRPPDAGARRRILWASAPRKVTP